MKNDKNPSSLQKAAIKTCVLGALLAIALASCGKSANRPAPPRPQTHSIYSPSDVERAVFTYSRSPSIHYQNGLGKEIPRLVIHT